MQNKEDGDVLVKVENLSKKYCKDLKTSLWYGIKDLVSGMQGNTGERLLRPKEFWAVKDINFELRRGECLGLIGHNGAGKSTLLKILNGLINPDAGKVTIKGRVGALIELGAGFNGILSGRENIYNNGAVLGFNREEIDTKLQAIIDFSELEEFIDQERYSLIDDHSPFINKGFNAILLIDFDYAHWHLTSDTADKISADSLKIVGDTILAWLIKD